MSLGFLSYMVWGHHMFVSGMNPVSSLAFSFPTLVITIPSTIIVLIWLGSLYGSKLRINSASLFSLAFISMFISGGVSGFFLAQPSIDIMLHATYFVVGHFHLVMGVAATFAILGALFFWFPKLYGRQLDETLGKIHFWITFAGVYCIFMPMHWLGLLDRAGNGGIAVAAQSPGAARSFITAAAIVTISAQAIFICNFFWSLLRAPDGLRRNPWHATTLEWFLPTPIPLDDFGRYPPPIYRSAYMYGERVAGLDFLPQHVAPEHLAKFS